MSHTNSSDCSIEILESRTMLSLAAPDVSFSGDGVNTYPFKASQVSYASAFDVQRDGKIVLAGETHGGQRIAQILLARLKADGTSDRSFGKNGQIMTHLPQGATAGALRVQSDGKIVIAGQ